MTSQDPTTPAEAPVEAEVTEVQEPAVEAMTPLPDGTPVPAPVAQRRYGGFLGMVAGGALALAAGFVVSHLDLLGLRPVPDDSAITALADRTATLEQGLAATAKVEEQVGLLSTRLDAMENAADAALPPLRADLQTLSGRLDKLEQSLAMLANLPGDGTVPPAQIAALSAAVETLRTELAGLKAAPDDDALRAIARDELGKWEAESAEKHRVEAEAIAAKAARAAALTRLSAAAETGLPYADALAALRGEALPDVITRYAETGLPPLSQGFADAARAALDAALRIAPGANLGDRLLSFLKVQTGARSLTPQEGDDPDAILSRAEAAVAAGDAQKALNEIAALAPEAQAELADWARLAQDRLAFVAAVQALSATATP
jgi:hypothetical protein